MSNVMRNVEVGQESMLTNIFYHFIFFSELDNHVSFLLPPVKPARKSILSIHIQFYFYKVYTSIYLEYIAHYIK